MHLWSFTVQESNEACSRTHTTELYNQSEKSLTGVRVGRWKGVSLFLNQASGGWGGELSLPPNPALPRKWAKVFGKETHCLSS